MIQIPKDITSKLKQLIQQSTIISIVGHTSPDGDAVTSVLALWKYLKKLNKKVYPILPDAPPNYLLWLNDIDKIIIGENAKDIITQSDIIFCLDFNEAKRTSILAETIISSKATKVLIDHHPFPESFPDIKISYPSASATAELVYLVIRELNKELIDKEIATLIFTGILSDTGCFCHNSANADTFEVIPELLKLGVNKAKIIDKLYHNFSYDRMRLMGYVLLNKLKIIPEYRFGYISLTEAELQQFNYQKGDHENFANLPLSIRNIDFSAMFMERDGKIRVSLRSNGAVDVGEIARNYLSGGGHHNAAGGDLEPPIEQAINYFITQLLPKVKFKNNED